jgi:hypothetical protein
VSAEGLTYDTGALVAAERDDRLVWALHRAALSRGLAPVVPAGVLAEGWRGGPQATMSRFLKGCQVEDLSKERARATGTLAARSGHNDVVDVSVVEGAIRRRHAIVTSNPTHMSAIADGAGVRLALHSV